MSSPEMRFFTHLTPQEVADVSWTNTMNLLCMIEAVILFISFIPIGFISYLNLKQRIFHWNANVIVGLYTAQYLISCSARLLLVLDQLQTGRVGQGSVLVANFVRSGCHFLSFYVLPSFLFERICASYFLKDYEKKTRLWIPILGMGSLLSMTFASTFLFTQELISLVGTFIFVIIANTIGYIGLVVIHRYNIRLHRKTLTRSTGESYSLSERYQIAENIKTSKLLAKIQLLIFIFSMSCAATLLVDNLDCETRTLIIFFSAFNFLCVIYGFLVPVVCISQVPVWQRELRQLADRMLCREVTAPVRHVTGTTGEQLSFHTNNQADAYFNQLQSMMADRSRENSVVPIK